MTPTFFTQSILLVINLVPTAEGFRDLCDRTAVYIFKGYPSALTGTPALGVMCAANVLSNKQLPVTRMNLSYTALAR